MNEYKKASVVAVHVTRPVAFSVACFISVRSAASRDGHVFNNTLKELLCEIEES